MPADIDSFFYTAVSTFFNTQFAITEHLMLIFTIVEAAHCR